MKLKKYDYKRNHFTVEEKSQILGDYDRPGNNAPQLYLVCNDRNPD